MMGPIDAQSVAMSEKDERTIVSDEKSDDSVRSRSRSSSSSTSELELQPVKSETCQPDDMEQGDINRLETIRTNHSTASRKSSVIERGYSHALSELDRGIVGWEGDDDPENPRNWPLKRKVVVMVCLSAITFLSPLASSMFAPGVVFMSEEFGNKSDILAALVVSIYVLGWAVGPLFLSPLSEIYGRRRVLDYANAIFVVWQIGCALAPNITSLAIFRVLSGIGGSGCLTIGGGVISDLFPPEQRGKAVAAYSLGPLFGPIVGPIAGGFLAQRVDWRWVFWILLIFGGVITTVIFFVNEESNPEVLLERKTERLRTETGNPDLINWYNKDRPKLPPREILKHGLLRPLKLIFRSPISILMCIYMSTVYGMMYLMFTSLPMVFNRQYKFDAETAGLAYLGIGIGCMVGIAIQARISDTTLERLAARNGGVAEPEMRMPACTFFAMFLPAALIWYGWSADYQTHWIVPIIGTMFFGIGMMGIFVAVQSYMIDAFPLYAASAVAALTSTRSILGAFLPLAGGPLFTNLGVGWGNTLLAFISFGLGGAVFLLYKYGAYIRTKYPVILD